MRNNMHTFIHRRRFTIFGRCSCVCVCFFSILSTSVLHCCVPLLPVLPQQIQLQYYNKMRMNKKKSNSKYVQKTKKKKNDYNMTQVCACFWYTHGLLVQWLHFVGQMTFFFFFFCLLGVLIENPNSNLDIKLGHFTHSFHANTQYAGILFCWLN